MKQYPKYKDSGINWLKQLPNDWGTKRLKYSSKVQFSNVDKKSFNDEIDVKLCNYTDVYNNEYITNDFNFMNATATSFEIEKFQLNKNDVLITKDSETPDDIAVPSFVKKDIPNTLCAYHLAQIQPKHQEILGEYLFRLFQVKDFNTKFITSANGVTRFGLNNYSIANINVTIPPIEQQKVIVNYLDKKTQQIDTLVEKKQKQIELLKEYRTAIINQAVIKGLNPNVKMKDSGIEWLGQIPEQWEVKRLKYLIQGQLKYGANEIAESIDKEFPRYIRITDFNFNGSLREDTFKSLSPKKANEYLLNEGDILFARSGATVGKTFQFKNYKGVACYAGYLIKATPDKKKILSDYLFYFTQSDIYENWKNSVFIQATIQNISAEKYNNLIIILPPLNEQNKIINYINDKMIQIEIEYKKIENQISLLQEYRTTLISDTVTGKIDVRDEVN